MGEDSSPWQRSPIAHSLAGSEYGGSGSVKGVCFKVRSWVVAHYQAVKQVVRRSPSVILVPLLLLAVLWGLGIWAVVALADHDVAVQKENVRQVGQEHIQQLARQLEASLAPVYYLSLAVQLNPYYPSFLQTFPWLASRLLKQELADSSLILMPHNVVTDVWPQEPRFTQLIGHNAFVEDRNRSIAMVNEQGLPSVDGPTVYPQFGLNVINLRIPVFIDNCTEGERFGLDFGPTDCPVGLCYNATSQRCFWGMVVGVLELNRQSNSSVTNLEQAGYNYQVAKVQSSGREETLYQSHQAPKSPQMVAITSLQTEWRLYISPEEGWALLWYPIALAFVIAGSLAMSICLFALLVSRKQHQALLESLLPMSVVRDLRSSVRQGRYHVDASALVDSGTPAERILCMMGQALQGQLPSLQDIMLVRTAILRSHNIYEPINLGKRMKADLENDVARALMHQLGNGMTVMQSPDSVCFSRETQRPLTCRFSNISHAAGDYSPSTRGQSQQEVMAGAFASLKGGLEAIMDPARLLQPPQPPTTPAQLMLGREEYEAEGEGECLMEEVVVVSPADGSIQQQQPLVPRSMESFSKGMSSLRPALPTSPYSQGRAIRITHNRLFDSAAGCASAPTPPPGSVGTSACHDSPRESYNGLMPAAGREAAGAGAPVRRQTSISGSEVAAAAAAPRTPRLQSQLTQHPNCSSPLPVLDPPIVARVASGRASGGGRRRRCSLQSLRDLLGGKEKEAGEEDSVRQVAALADLTPGSSSRPSPAPSPGQRPALGSPHNTWLVRNLGLVLPPRPIYDVVEQVLADVDQWQYDSFRLYEVTGGHPLSTLAYFLFHRAGLITTFKINQVKLARFLCHIEAGYKKAGNPYHNEIHGADVLRLMHVIVTKGGLTPHYADPLTHMACYLVAAIHDFEHLGLTNDFLINSGHSLALQYNDRSPLENHHAAAAFTALRQADMAFLARLETADKARLRKMVIEMVMATDMKQHFAITSQFSSVHRLTEAQDRAAGGGEEGGNKHSGSAEDAVPCRPLDEAERLLSLQMALKVCDLGHLTADLAVHQRWLICLEEEFFRQGDKEAASGMPISPLFDRSKQGASKSQVGFFDFVALPMFNNFCRVFKRCCPLLQQANTNYRHWCDLDPGKQAKQQQQQGHAHMPAPAPTLTPSQSQSLIQTQPRSQAQSQSQSQVQVHGPTQPPGQAKAHAQVHHSAVQSSSGGPADPQHQPQPRGSPKLTSQGSGNRSSLTASVLALTRSLSKKLSGAQEAKGRDTTEAAAAEPHAAEQQDPALDAGELKVVLVDPDPMLQAAPA